MAAEAGWDETALQTAFRRELTDQVRDALMARVRPTSLDELIDWAVKLDNYQRERHCERAPAAPFLRSPVAPRSSSPPASLVPPPGGFHGGGEEPMQLGRARLSVGEWRRRLTAGLCLYCGQEGHLISQCSVRPKD